MDDLNQLNLKRFEFHGDAKEWFGIWIVNLLLSICTLGVYSAWAKVRRNKYFYNNTLVDGRSFDYHATGPQILKGRLVVVGVVVLSALLVSQYPPLGLAFFLVITAAFPWLITKSIKFKARMTSFSNVRFDFHGGMGGAFLVYLLFPVLAYGGAFVIYTTGVILLTGKPSVAGASMFLIVVVLWIMVAMPVVDRARTHYVIGNHSLGVSNFKIDAPYKPFIFAFFAASLWFSMFGSLIIGLLYFWGGSSSKIQGSFESLAFNFNFSSIGYYLLFFGAFLPAGAIYQSLTRNVIYNQMLLDTDHRFLSTVRPMTLFWVLLSNAIITLMTLGLMLPWAQVRMAKYLADHTAAIPNGSMDDFVGEMLPEGSAIGDAYTDLEAIDIGLPI